ncbi:S-protein homolog 29-like [Henckelia pumila]|uniref:S-protein homolog 29-like n=1 Tax=Henckelia pumila TaxID=405737 RepID=UPI003C6DF1E6
MRIVLVINILSLWGVFRVARSCTLTSQYDVSIISNLPPNTPELSMTCWSKDDNLGKHTLAPGQNYSFSFCESAWGTSKFTCHVWWINGKDKTFDVYDSDWDNEPCDKSDHCYWFVQADGIYFANRNPPRRLEIVYPW